MFVFLTIFGVSLGMTLRRECPSRVWVIYITILFESVLVVLELLLESLDWLLLLNEDILELLPLLVYLDEWIVQHSVLLLEVIVLLRVHLLVVADLLSQDLILLLKVCCLFLVLEVLLWPRSAACRSDWLLGFWKPHLPDALLGAVVVAIRKACCARITLKGKVRTPTTTCGSLQRCTQTSLSQLLSLILLLIQFLLLVLHPIWLDTLHVLVFE